MANLFLFKNECVQSECVILVENETVSKRERERERDCKCFTQREREKRLGGSDVNVRGE